VLYDGKMVARLDPSGTNVDALGCYMTGTDPAGGGELDIDAVAAEVASAHPLAVVAPTTTVEGATPIGTDRTGPPDGTPGGPDLTKGAPT
jgi:hypothetical protein